MNDLSECYDGYCNDDGAGTAFCDCWDNGQDLDIGTCECADLNLDAVCEGLDLSEYDEGEGNCAAATHAIGSITVCDDR